MKPTRTVQLANWQADATVNTSGSGTEAEDSIATEVPIALTYNRMSHVVMMATPTDLEDFALGFSLTEGLIGSPEDLLSSQVVPRQGGLEVAMTISEDWFDRLATQRRNLTGRTGCGLCGAESIEQALRYPDPVGNTLKLDHQAIQSAVAAMQSRQALQRLTGATHAAAWCSEIGSIEELREDVGRHNALDKLIGALARKGFDAETGFVVVSSRASYEMVYKSAVMGMQLIVAVSAPTSLAVEFAERCGQTLVGFARPGRHNIYSFGQRIHSGSTHD